MNRLIIFFLLTCQFGFSQNIEKEIYLVHNLYATGFDNDEYLYSTDSIKIENNRKTSDLLNAISNVQSVDYVFKNSKIDTLKILNNPLELIKKYKNSKVDWNKEQQEFIKPKLRDLDTYKKYYLDYLNNGCCITMHQRYRDEYQIRIFKNDVLENEITSRKSTGGFKIPWSNSLTGIKNYNFDIEDILFDIIKSPRKKQKTLAKSKLQKYLINKIMDNNMRKLYELSAYTYFTEIKELEPEFDIKHFGEVYGRGRYIWDEPKTIKITLQNEYFLPNVFIQFLASEYDNTLYSRDSIKADYKKLVNRIQSIEFINNYLQNDSSSVLDIYYFNNTGINEYNINSVNKNPTEWKKHDDYVQSLKWYETSDIKLDFDVEEAIKTSELNNCGCNYKFDRTFIEQAVFFEVTSSRNASSIWFLLPNDTLLLHHVQSYHIDKTKVFDIELSTYGENINLPRPCLLFDRYGKLIIKK
jgi:hypothetical protein